MFTRLGQPLGRSRNFSAEFLAPVGEALKHEPPRIGETQTLAEDGLPHLELTPFAGNDIVRGFLVRNPSNDTSAQLAIPALRSLLALEYERHWLLGDATRRERSHRMTRLVELADKGGARAYLRSLGVTDSALRGLAVEAKNDTHAEVLVDDLSVLLNTSLIRQQGKLVECLTVDDPRRALSEYGLSSAVGIGTLLAPEHVGRTLRQAKLALETSRRVDSPIEYLDGAAHEFLIRIAPPTYLEDFAAAALAPIEHARGGNDLVTTLSSWLSERRSLEATALRLGVHRHTVRNRIQRIAQLTGHDLESIDVQTELWLALKAKGANDAT